MRYNKTISGYESEVDYPKYFLSKEGKTNPQKELKATLKAFAKSIKSFKNINQHPVCLFPGRYTYLESIGKIEKKFNIEQCQDFVTFRDKLELKSVSIIFSSYFINKPASAFGHTLLKLNKEDPMTGDLKSYGVDFSAQVTTKNPIAYGVMGIMGGFYGRFSLLPYFLKLREYNDYESRDLWEFELNLTQSELKLFSAHLWDMNLALFDYYYFSENCSYHVQRFIDAIKPEWKLLKELYDITVPIDTLIPLIQDKNIISGIYYRPSLNKRSQMQLDALNNEQLEFVKSSMDSLSLQENNTLSDQAQVEALDAMMDFTDYKYPVELHLDEKNNDIKDFKLEVLSKRSTFDINSKKTNKIKKDHFEYAHKARKFRLGNRNATDSGYELKHRFALHNILEPEGDVYSNFSLEMGKTSLFFDTDKDKLIFEEFEVAHVMALRPISYLEKKISWNFNFGLNSRYDIIAPFLNVGIGPSFQLGHHNLSLFVQAENNMPFNERRYQESLLGINSQWVYKYDRFGLKVNYKKFKELVFGVENIEVITSEASYVFEKDFQLSLNTLKTENDDQTSVLCSFYY